MRCALHITTTHTHGDTLNDLHAATHLHTLDDLHAATHLHTYTHLFAHTFTLLFSHTRHSTLHTLTTTTRLLTLTLTYSLSLPITLTYSLSLPISLHDQETRTPSHPIPSHPSHRHLPATLSIQFISLPSLAAYHKQGAKRDPTLDDKGVSLIPHPSTPPCPVRIPCLVQTPPVSLTQLRAYLPPSC
ncbi:hypothetical protein M011DRAFT_213868 [Sporormia fimetaria CBS 119925]|uniref:Uncharacterized protein n=1 Tax=Sporormia fimetaria CBS 119925 TaxID=1340428 RepID=A0A6A6V2T3_9PLEO|nr:hypothetical protein M011DRAFT_213868 [Sporormia fimetaria CBS 119925]